MAYGDANPGTPALRWEEFEQVDYFMRLRDLMNEWNKAFGLAHSPFLEPDDPEVGWAAAECERLEDALEETALEFAAYRARLRMGRDDGRP